MKISKNSLVLTAAFTGLLGGTMTRLNAGVASSGNSGSNISAAGQFAGTTMDAKKEKHACKGQNSCKGQGFKELTAQDCEKAKQSQSMSK